MSAKVQAYRVGAAVVLLVAGYLLSCWYFGAWRNPATDFVVWSPMGFGMAVLESWFVWEVFFRSFRAKEHPVLSGVIFTSVLLFNGLVIG